MRIVGRVLRDWYGNRGKPSNRKIRADTKERAMTFVRERYHDFGPTLAAD